MAAIRYHEVAYSHFRAVFMYSQSHCPVLLRFHLHYKLIIIGQIKMDLTPKAATKTRYILKE